MFHLVQLIDKGTEQDGSEHFDQQEGFQLKDVENFIWDLKDDF